MVNGWLTSKKDKVENRDLWEKLLAYWPDYTFYFFLIKGHVAKGAFEETKEKAYVHFVKHNGDRFSYEEFLVFCEKNNRADELANIGIDEARS
jgi:ribonuclease HI